MNRKLRGNLLLLITAFIWGSCFVAQSIGMEHVGPFTFNAVRMSIGGILLIPVIFILGKREPAKESDTKESLTPLLVSGVVCGLVLFFASSVQQVGIQYTTAGKAGFITSLYIILVPILSFFLGEKIRKTLWFCVLLAAAGLYLLCIKEGFSMGKGDFIMLFSALGYGLHILAINHFAPKVDSIKLSCFQFFVCGGISFVPAFIFESPQVSSILLAWASILYAGLLSCAIGFTFQTIAQKDTDPTVTSLILSTESVFAVLTGFMVLHEILSPREIAGCALMLIAIIIAQLPAKHGHEILNDEKDKEEVL